MSATADTVSYRPTTTEELNDLLARYGLLVVLRARHRVVYVITPANKRTVSYRTYVVDIRIVNDIPVVIELDDYPADRKPLDEILTRARIEELDALDQASDKAEELATWGSPPAVVQAQADIYRAREVAEDALRRALFGSARSGSNVLYVRIDRDKRDVSVVAAADLDDYTPLTPDWFAIDELPDAVTYDQLKELVRLRQLGESSDAYKAAKAALLLEVFPATA
jgi:hypothetical protein